MILDPLTAETAVKLIMNESGAAVLLYKGTLKRGYDWVQYDEQARALQFITEDGETQELGMTIHEPFHTFFRSSEELSIVTVNDDKVCDGAVTLNFLRLVE